MGRNSWDGGLGDSQEDAFELLEKGKTHQPSQASTLDSIKAEATAPRSALPAKPLPSPSTTHVVRSVFWTGALAAFIIITLSILTSRVSTFLPDTKFALDSQVSCDLSTGRNNTFQNGFILNLRASTHLTFTEAKAIDVIWQLFVGAGGRFWLAWISYRVFMDGLTRLTENSPLPYNLYASLTFSTTTLWTAYYALKAVFFSKGWRSKAFLLWFGFSTLYILGFPTLMSATAGYVSPSTAGFNMSDGTFLTPTSDSLCTCFAVYAGALIGYTNDTIASGPPIIQYNAVDASTGPRNHGPNIEDLGVPNFKDSYPLYFQILNSTYNYPEAIYDATNTTSPYNLTSTGQEIAPPSLVVNANYTSNITIDNHTYHFRNWKFVEYERPPAYMPFYCYQNRTIPDLTALAECLPEKYFVWGLSSLMVYINLCLLIVWTFGMYLVWADANIYSALCRSGRKVRGHFRAVADLSEAMDEVLGKETCAYTDSQLAHELSMQPGIKYYASDPSEGDVSHIGLSSRRLGKVPYNSTKLYGKREKGQ